MRAFQTLVVIGLTIAVVLVLAKVIWGSPLVAHVREGFANGSSGPKPVNTMTECPAGSVMYMYDGIAYCCGGQVAPDANEVQGSCRPATSAPNAPAPLFCSLGPTSKDTGIPNCIETRAGMMDVLGEEICPTSMPNPVIARDGSTSCCASAPNADYTACMDPTKPSCGVTSDPKWVQDPQSCQWIQFNEVNGACPSGLASFTAPGPGAMSGATLFGCLDHSTNQVCYSQALINTLTQMGYDASGLGVCSSNSGTSS